MKKLLSLLLCVTILLSAAVFSGCGKCDHSYGKWKVTTEPTCTESGEQVRICKECDEEDTKKIEPYGHTEKIVPAVEPTCTAAGTQEGVICEDCGAVIVEPKEIAKSEHSYEESIVKDATCSKDGEKKFTCTFCGESYSESFTLSAYTATEVHDKVQNSVAEIITYDKKGNGLALGSGFVYNGNIVTNFHVIDGAYSATVSVNGKTYDATKVVSYDETMDIAILAINTGGDSVTSLTICTETHAVGSTVYAVGSSRGQTDTFSQGIVTHAQREIDGVTYVQHDAAISSGNSGGPLVNQYCEVIGINTFGYKESQNLNFAISVSQISKLKTQNLSFSAFYDKVSNPIARLGNYALTYGNYESDYSEYCVDTDTTSTDGYTYYRYYYYNPTDNSLEFWLSISAGYYFVLEINSIGGSYEWTFFDDDYNYISGYVYPSTFTSTSSLSGSDTNITNYDLYTSGTSLATSMMRIICNAFSIDLADAGVTASDLGFVNFN